MFLQVADRHNEKVRKCCDLKDFVANEDQSFESISEGYDFTFRASDSDSSDDDVEVCETPPH